MLRVTPALHKVLDDLCKIARIPESNRSAFRAAAWSAIEVCSYAIWADEREESFKQKKPYDRKSLRRIAEASADLAKASAELSDALRKRTTGANYYLIWQLERSDYQEVPPEVVSLRCDLLLESSSVIVNADAAIRMAGAAKRAIEHLNDPHPDGPPTSGKAGAPPHSRNNPALLLTKELSANAAKFGGRLTLTKSVGKSVGASGGNSLVRALKCCKPVLKGFKIPSLSTLQRFKNRLGE